MMLAGEDDQNLIRVKLAKVNDDDNSLSSILCKTPLPSNAEFGYSITVI